MDEDGLAGPELQCEQELKPLQGKLLLSGFYGENNPLECILR